MLFALRKALDEAVKKEGVSLGVVYDGIVWPIQEGGVEIFDILRCEIELTLFESHTDILVTRGGRVTGQLFTISVASALCTTLLGFGVIGKVISGAGMRC